MEALYQLTISIMSKEIGYMIYVDIMTKENLSSIYLAIIVLIYLSVRSYSRSDSRVKLSKSVEGNVNNLNIKVTGSMCVSVCL